MIRRTTIVHDTPVGRDKNEDRVVVSQLSGIYGVFDGAGGLSADVPGLPMSGAQIASSIIARACADATTGSLRDAVIRGNLLLKFEQKRFGVPDDKKKRWGTTVAAVKVSDHDFEWVVVGDSVIIVKMIDGSFYLPGGLDYDHDGPAFKMLLELHEKGYTDKAEIDRILWPIHEATRDDANVRYGVINGEATAENFIQSGRLSLDGVSDIIMVTDGLFLPAENPLAPDDWAAWLNLYQEGGLDHILRSVRTMQANDPNCLMYPRLKGGDDVGAVALRMVD